MDLLDEGKREGGEWNGCCNSSKGELWWRLKWILLTQADDDEQGGERNQKLQIPTFFVSQELNFNLTWLVATNIFSNKPIY